MTARDACLFLVPGSFRDPSGFLFWRDGVLYRQVNRCYSRTYDRLNESGLCEELSRSGQLIEHEEAGSAAGMTDDAYKVLKPRLIPFISYPYEWCFSHLKDAALLTLDIQKKALDRGMSLKDASAYNAQVFNGRQVLIDILSFEEYVEGSPWVAYKQFCEHFLAPLALMSRKDERLSQLLRVHLDGIPLDLASSLLPFCSKLSPSLFLHVALHARSQKKYLNQVVKKESVQRNFSRRSFFGLLESLEAAVHALSCRQNRKHWLAYYDTEHNYSGDSLGRKESIVSAFLDRIMPKTVWDFGANTGKFSRLAARKGAYTVSWDIDPACVESNYRTMLEQRETHILPLLLDLTNPSPGIGWDNTERMTLSGRGAADAGLALGLVHHLAISNNVPLPLIAAYFRKLCEWLIIEFIPKEDSQVQRLLSMREDVFPHYTREHFEKAFGAGYSIQETVPIPGTLRSLYLMRKNSAL
jgi:ribosomal protein L11 methylase PrmA